MSALHYDHALNKRLTLTLSDLPFLKVAELPSDIPMVDLYPLITFLSSFLRDSTDFTKTPPASNSSSPSKSQSSTKNQPSSSSQPSPNTLHPKNLEPYYLLSFISPAHPSPSQMKLPAWPKFWSEFLDRKIRTLKSFISLATPPLNLLNPPISFNRGQIAYLFFDDLFTDNGVSIVASCLVWQHAFALFYAFLRHYDPHKSSGSQKFGSKFSQDLKFWIQLLSNDLIEQQDI